MIFSDSVTGAGIATLKNKGHWQLNKGTAIMHIILLQVTVCDCGIFMPKSQTFNHKGCGSEQHFCGSEQHFFTAMTTLHGQPNTYSSSAFLGSDLVSLGALKADLGLS